MENSVIIIQHLNLGLFGNKVIQETLKRVIRAILLSCPFQGLTPLLCSTEETQQVLNDIRVNK